MAQTLDMSMYRDEDTRILSTLPALVSAQFREMLGRPVTWLVIAGTFVVLLLTRYLAVFALGEELSLLRELLLSNTLIAVILLSALTSATPGQAEAVERADRYLLSRAIPRWSPSAARFVAGIGLTLIALAIWGSAIWLAYKWFLRTDLGRFSLAQEGSAPPALPISALLMLWLLSWMLIALAELVSRGRHLAMAVLALLVFVVVGIAIPIRSASEDAGWIDQVLALIMPNLAIYAPGIRLTSEIETKGVIGGVLQALGYALIFLTLASLRLRDCR